MKTAEYLQMQQDLLMIGSAVDRLNLHGFIGNIERAESFGAILDPTLFRKAQANLRGLKKLAESLLPVQEAFTEFRGAVIETSIHGFMQKSKETPNEQG